jgi:hypothetical protein
MAWELVCGDGSGMSYFVRRRSRRNRDVLVSYGSKGFTQILSDDMDDNDTRRGLRRERRSSEKEY